MVGKSITAIERELRRISTELAVLADDIDSMRVAKVEMGARRGWDHPSIAEIETDIARFEAIFARMERRKADLRRQAAAA